MSDTTQGIGLAVSTVIFALRAHPETGLSALWIPLVRRTRDPFEGSWALPGGWVRESESLADAAGRNLLETTAVEPSYLEQLYCFGEVDRSPDRRVVSVVYWALVRPEQTERSEDGDNVRWFLADELPELAFDHNVIVDYALWRLRTKVEYSRIAQAFLGSTFTLAELREVHEAVLQRALDPANFRRQVEPTLVPTDAVVTGGRHRPPRLYRYDESISLVDNGPLTHGPAPQNARSIA
ncbi:8-oxo-dGTP diphosphatase [Microbacteriaceae bacterium SG_E_30_P1]|uniref:8-oxo-dGTP diphosphatase n=1 Tax=Antiquaquibacter oligotrophicus TaxID=2880260 RepID=A0ABT6KMQ6_9MICO|nr:NUDIX domain-containing protein [Antiquaquibacter oligotrophicus]MDH6181129.1 8-oxo-dGTP diphosphatase [Antiquaquibacter oligotrophicus]UDF13174.1 NUDIX hydrolase [Antiquaquibacter oligotrophicus]